MIENEYGIKTKPASSGNQKANATIERLHQILGNLVRTYNLQETYVDDTHPFMVILAAVDFEVQYTYHQREKSQAN